MLPSGPTTGELFGSVVAPSARLHAGVSSVGPSTAALPVWAASWPNIGHSGASEGSACGVTAFEGADSGPSPTAFRARTLKVYVAPFVRPVRTTWVTFPTVLDACAVVPMYGVTM